MSKAFVYAAMSVAAIIGVSCVSVTRAGSQDFGRDSASLLLFSGLDLWRGGNFSHGGAYWSPAGLDREGFTLKALVSGGVYRYTSGALGNIRVYGRELGAQILPGWRFQRDTLEIKVFAGLEIRDHRLTPDDPSASLRGKRTGLRTAAEVWYQPSIDTMLAGHASISTIGTMHDARVALGWRLFDAFYAGPEVAEFSAYEYRQWRFGLHLTALKTGEWEWSGAVGFARDSDQVSGAYGRVGVLTRR